MRIIVVLLYLLLILIGISFAALNATTVAVNFYFKTVNMPVSVLAVIMLGVGILIGFILFILKYWRLKIVNSKIKNQLNKLIVLTRGKNGAIAINGDEVVECGIKNLRTIPLRNEDSAF